MTLSGLKLFGSYTSPFVRHCRIVLTEENLPCEFVETDAAGSAKQSAMQKVPFMSGELNGEPIQLTDSSAIIRLLREQGGNTFIPDPARFNDYCATNTLMDTAINLFYLEKDGVTDEQSAYLARQQSRLTTGLTELNGMSLVEGPYDDLDLRLACFLDWALYRKRFDLAPYPVLEKFLQQVKKYQPFADTAPPQ